MKKRKSANRNRSNRSYGMPCGYGTGKAFQKKRVQKELAGLIVNRRCG